MNRKMMILTAMTTIEQRAPSPNMARRGEKRQVIPLFTPAICSYSVLLCRKENRNKKIFSPTPFCCMPHRILYIQENKS